MGFKTDGLFDDHVCRECKVFHCGSRRSLGNHLARSHKEVDGIRGYVLRHFLDGKTPLCLCGCGGESAWHRVSYRFNDYITGHNPAGFRVQQPKLTEEQVARRNQDIRRAYDERGKEIGAKISAGVTSSRSARSSKSGSGCLTFQLPSDKPIPDDWPIVDRETLIRTNETGLFPGAPGRAHTESKTLPELAAFIRAHVERWGWFYPPAPGETLSDVLEALRRRPALPGRDLPGSSSTATHFLQHRFRSYWDVLDGPSRAFSIPGLLEKVLRYRLGLNDSKPYDYVLSDGTRVTCRETFDVSLAAIRRGFVVRGKAVSFFKPAVAFEVYRALLSDYEGSCPTVWDPSGGFGARMLGFAAAFPAGIYLANEPASPTRRDLLALGEELERALSDFDHAVFPEGSEAWAPADGTVDLVFTSPPYHDTERYFDEPGQCWRDFPGREAWRAGYLLPTVQNARRCLKPGRLLALNVSGKYVDDVERAAGEAGFVRRQDLDLNLRLRRGHFVKKATGVASPDASEPVLVFQKPL